MKRIHYALITIVTLAMGALATGCQKEDDIRPIFGDENPNDNNLVGTTWTYSYDNMLSGTSVAYQLFSEISFAEIDKGTFMFMSDLMEISTNSDMTYTLHDGQGSITLHDATGREATVSFVLLDEDHLKVTLTPAVALRDSSNLAIIFYGHGGALEAVYSRWDSGTNIAELYGSNWTTDHSSGAFIDAAGGYYCNMHIVSRIKFDMDGGGTMTCFYDGNWGETPFASADTLRRNFLAYYNGVELRLLFDDMSEAVLSRAVVNNDPVLIMTATAEAFMMDGNAATLMNELSERLLNRIRYNHPADLEDDRGIGELHLRGETIGLYLLQQQIENDSRHIYNILGERDYLIYMSLDTALEPGSYHIGGLTSIAITSPQDLLIPNEGTISITNISGGYRIDVSGKTEEGQDVTLYYQGPLNDYNTVE